MRYSALIRDSTNRPATAAQRCRNRGGAPGVDSKVWVDCAAMGILCVVFSGVRFVIGPAKTRHTADGRASVFRPGTHDFRLDLDVDVKPLVELHVARPAHFRPY